MRLTYTLWGGRYNPIIPVNNREMANQLVDVFRVDALYPAADDPQLHEFIKAFPYLPWPQFYKELFIQGMRGKLATFLDVYHPVRRIFEEHIEEKAEPLVNATLFEWDPTDPLCDVLLAHFGSYPSKEEIGKDYANFVERNLRGRRIQLRPVDPIPGDSHIYLTPSAISAYGLQWDRAPVSDGSGVYVGRANEFADVLNFWNLRAANTEIIFYDPTHEVRVRSLKDSYLDLLHKRPEDPTGQENLVAVWSKADAVVDVAQFGPKVVRCTVTDATWNRLNLKPPLIFIEV